MGEFRATCGEEKVLEPNPQVGAAPWLQALGIDDVESYDAPSVWASAPRGSLKIPFGFCCKTSESGIVPTDELFELDLAAERAGILQGKTGSGLTFLQRAWMTAAAVRFGPERVKFLLLQLPGWAGFRGLEKLPHVAGVFSHLYECREVFDELVKALEAELDRRRAVLAEYAATSFDEYSRRRDLDESLPGLPHLFVVMEYLLDFAENIRPEHMAIFRKILSAGPALGVHLIFTSEGEAIVGQEEVLRHTTFGLSLYCSSESASRCVVGTASAAYLLFGRGDGIAVCRALGSGVPPQYLRVFNIEQRETQDKTGWYALMDKMSQYSAPASDEFNARLGPAKELHRAFLESHHLHLHS